MNMMAVGQHIARYVANQLGVDAATLGRAGSASALVGSTQEMCDTLERHREALAPGVERMAGR